MDMEVGAVMILGVGLDLQDNFSIARFGGRNYNSIFNERVDTMQTNKETNDLVN